MRRSSARLPGYSGSRPTGMQVGAVTARVVDEPLEQVMRALGSVDLQYRVDRFEPFPRFDGVEILKFRQVGHASRLASAIG